MNIPRLLAPKLVLTMAAWAFLFGMSPSGALAMPTESAAVAGPASVRTAQIDAIVNTLSRPQAQLHLRLAGISPTQLREHLSRLDDVQLAMVAHKTEMVKAGGELGLIIALLVVTILVIVLIKLLNKDVEIKDKKT